MTQRTLLAAISTVMILLAGCGGPGTAVVASGATPTGAIHGCGVAESESIEEAGQRIDITKMGFNASGLSNDTVVQLYAPDGEKLHEESGLTHERIGNTTYVVAPFQYVGNGAYRYWFVEDGEVVGECELEIDENLFM